MRLNFRPKTEIQRFFTIKRRWSPKKKKITKKVFIKIETDFSAEIRNSKVFSAQKQVVSKKKKNKKKRSSLKLRLVFRLVLKIQTFEGGLFSYGGAIFNFSQKIGLKSTKNVRFCILHKPMGGLKPPPRPPLATLLFLMDIAKLLFRILPFFNDYFTLQSKNWRLKLFIMLGIIFIEYIKLAARKNWF